MNKYGQIWMLYMLVVFIVIIFLFAAIPAFKETLDESRGLDSTLNCPGTPTHDLTDYQDDTTAQKLIRRPVCFVTGLYMVYFIGAVMLGYVVWAYRSLSNG